MLRDEWAESGSVFCGSEVKERVENCSESFSLIGVMLDVSAGSNGVIDFI